MTQNDLILSEGPRVPADRHPALVYLASLGAGSIPAQRSALNGIAHLCGLDKNDKHAYEKLPWWQMRYQHAQKIRALLQDRYSPATANRYLVALRRVVREAYQLGYIPAEDYTKIREIKGIKNRNDDSEAALSGRYVAPEEIVALLDACAADPTPAGTRDAAVIALGYGLGLRRAEVADLKLSDYNREGGTVAVRQSKGNRTRHLPIDNGPRDYLEDWLQVRGDAPGRVFWGVNKGGNLSTKRLGQRAVHSLYLKRAEEAGLIETTFHDLRRSFITDLLDRGNDVALVAKLAGHSSTATTMRYDRRRMERRREAINTLTVPYHKKHDRP
jgi:integrase/recombinase XerD